MSDTHTITYSEMAAMDHCMRKWWFRYDQLLEPRTPRSALTVGTAAHYGIEHYYTYPDKSSEEIIKKTLEHYDEEHAKFISSGGFPKGYDKIEEDKKLISSMLHEFVKETNSMESFEIISLEEEFNLPIINPYTKEVHDNLRLLGKVDGYAKINGHHFLLEHKTGASASGDWWWKYLNQIYTYVYAFQRKHQVRFTGAYINLLIKKIPSKPKFLKKSGELSKQLGTTTVETFVNGLINAGKDPDDYKEMIKEIESCGNPFIRRKPIYIRNSELEEIEKKIWHAMQRKLSTSYYSRNRSDLCSYMCSFKPVCNNDMKELREELYTKRPDRHSELEEYEPNDN